VSRSGEAAPYSRLGRIVVEGERGGDTGEEDRGRLRFFPKGRDVDDEGPADWAPRKYHTKVKN
jgi:hypothetical protein